MYRRREIYQRTLPLKVTFDKERTPTPNTTAAPDHGATSSTATTTSTTSTTKNQTSLSTTKTSIATTNSVSSSNFKFKSISSDVAANSVDAAAAVTATATSDEQPHTATQFTNSQLNVEEPSALILGRYINWNVAHGELAAQAWCCIGDLMAFCDKYEYRTLSLTDARAHAIICAEVQALLSGQAPFDMRKRFPGNIHNPENLWVCIGRCVGVDYHLQRILAVFRRPLEKLSTDKQRAARQNFHLAINELRLDISARITEVRLYDRNIFEKEFHLHWQNTME